MAKVLVTLSSTIHLGEGFTEYDKSIFTDLLNNSLFRDRDSVEYDPCYKQIIPYVVISENTSDRILVYNRSKQSDEARLHDKFSLGVGGHIEDVDDTRGYDAFYHGMRREIQEEIGLVSHCDYRILGFINDNSNDVGRVHLGIAVQLFVDEINCHHGENDILIKRQKLSLKEIQTIEHGLESWSRILYTYLMAHAYDL